VLFPALKNLNTLFIFLTAHNCIFFPPQKFTQVRFYTTVIKNILRTGKYSTDTSILLLQKQVTVVTTEQQSTFSVFFKHPRQSEKIFQLEESYQGNNTLSKHQKLQ